MRDTKTAFVWIVSILRKKKIPFQITGGLAARVYGSKRKLADIDIEIYDRDFPKLIPTLQAEIEFGPRRFHDKHWNVLLMTLRKVGQRIDISGVESLKIFDRKKGNWIKLRANMNGAVSHLIFGTRVPITSKADLIAYKTILARGVDLRDIEELT